jgi:hypothetical protein
MTRTGSASETAVTTRSIPWAVGHSGVDPTTKWGAASPNPSGRPCDAAQVVVELPLLTYAVGMRQDTARASSRQIADAVLFPRELHDVAACHACPPLQGGGEGFRCVTNENVGRRHPHGRTLREDRQVRGPATGPANHRGDVMPDGSPATAVYEWAGSRLIAREIDHLDGPAPLNRMRPGPPPRPVSGTASTRCAYGSNPPKSEPGSPTGGAAQPQPVADDTKVVPSSGGEWIG